uniref:Uncharacterized protein n=1 Tax=Arcella intermedia TaxID=1963864 RepID=A0A6B2LH63_9EUKA
MDNTFTQKSATINVEFAVKTFKVKDKYVKIQMWDTAGQEQYRAVTRSYYRSAKGAILVYDTTKADTFHNLNTWVKDVLDVPGNEDTQILLIGNKIDLVDQRDVKTEDGKQFAVEHGMNFMETSALTGTNVDLAFKILLTDIHKLHFKDLENSGPSTSNNNPSAGIVLTPQAPVSEDCCEGSIDSQIDTLKSFASSFFN